MNKLKNLLLLIFLLLTVTFISCDDKDKDDDENMNVTGVSLNSNELTLFIGYQETLAAAILPHDATEQGVEWMTSDSSIVTVENGVLTGIAEGDATITVTTVDGGHTASCKITVIPISVQGVSLNHSSALLAINGTVTLTATISPEDVTDKAVEWSTSNTSIVKVDNGVLTAVAEGDATITVTTIDGGHTATCNVSVVSNTITMTTNKNDVTLSMAGSSGISIDWGDGIVEFSSLSNNGTYSNFSHSYANSITHNITIAGYDITKLSCADNQLTTLDLSKNAVLTTLSCSENLFTTLDLSKNSLLTELSCGDNQLTNLDLSNNKALTTLDCRSNEMTNLDLKNNTSLKTLDCSYNQLTILDVSNNTPNGMISLNCSFNQLTKLILGNGHSMDLNCSNNKLTELDMSNFRTGGYFRLQNNLLDASALNAIFNNLHTIPLASTGSINDIYIGGNTGANDCDISIATDKRWKVYR